MVDDDVVHQEAVVELDILFDVAHAQIDDGRGVGARASRSPADDALFAAHALERLERALLRRILASARVRRETKLRRLVHKKGDAVLGARGNGICGGARGDGGGCGGDCGGVGDTRVDLAFSVATAIAAIAAQRSCASRAVPPRPRTGSDGPFSSPMAWYLIQWG